jgi:hypothetical protein
MTPKEELIQAIEESPDEIVRSLLEILQALQRQPTLETGELQKTVLERMGGAPKHLLSDGDLSDRDHRRAAILNHLQQKHRHNS